MEMRKEISRKVIPYYGYDKGFNLILYDDCVHSAEDAVDLLKDLYIPDNLIEDILFLVQKDGYCVIQNDKTHSDFLKIMEKEVRRHNFQCEIFHEPKEHNRPNSMLFGAGN